MTSKLDFGRRVWGCQVPYRLVIWWNYIKKKTPFFKTASLQIRVLGIIRGERRDKKKSVVHGHITLACKQSKNKKNWCYRTLVSILKDLPLASRKILFFPLGFTTLSPCLLFFFFFVHGKLCFPFFLFSFFGLFVWRQ